MRALILGYLTETNFRRVLLASEGGRMTFLHSPVSIVCFILAAGVFLLPFFRSHSRA